MALFKKYLIPLILEGKKTQTRRRHTAPRLKKGRVYHIKKNWFEVSGYKLLITKVYKQKLRDMTPDEASKEGGYTITQFRELWIKINGSWDPEEEVVVYEFKLHEPTNLNGFIGSRKPK